MDYFVIFFVIFFITVLSNYIYLFLINKIDYSNIKLKYSQMYVKYIFLINNRSGSRRGIDMRELLISMDIKTYDIYKLSKSEELQNELSNIIDRDTVICICGGDGSISWACSIIDKCVLKIFPKICVVPMGTGNDLSRTLGWGIKNLSKDKTIQLFDKIRICINLGRVSKIDWWNIEYLDCDKSKVNHMPTKMLCYISFGYDARISHNYQNDRNSNPEKFNSQFYNKLMYIKHGFSEFFIPSTRINDKVKLSCDNKRINVPVNCRSLKMLNINSAASGVFFWGNKVEKQHRVPTISDNRLEIVSSYGVHNLVGMNMGISEIKRISQSSETIVDVEEGVYIQIDGEGFRMPKCKVKINRFKQIPIVVGYKKTLGIPNMDNTKYIVRQALKLYKKDYFRVKDKSV